MMPVGAGIPLAAEYIGVTIACGGNFPLDSTPTFCYRLTLTLLAKSTVHIFDFYEISQEQRKEQAQNTFDTCSLAISNT